MKIVRKNWITALFFASVLSIPIPAASQTLCDSLQQIRAGSYNKFSAITGRRISEGRAVGTASIEGYSCQVRKGSNDYDYFCRSAPRTKAESLKTAKLTFEKAKACLPKTLESYNFTETDGRPMYWIHERDEWHFMFRADLKDGKWGSEIYFLDMED